MVFLPNFFPAENQHIFIFSGQPIGRQIKAATGGGALVACRIYGFQNKGIDQSRPGGLTAGAAPIPGQLSRWRTFTGKNHCGLAAAIDDRQFPAGQIRCLWIENHNLVLGIFAKPGSAGELAGRQR